MNNETNKDKLPIYEVVFDDIDEIGIQLISLVGDEFINNELFRLKIITEDE
jgi:hypothetical protein